MKLKILHPLIQGPGYATVEELVLYYYICVCVVVDSKVRVQLGPSPVNHEKNINRLNKWFRFI